MDYTYNGIGQMIKQDECPGKTLNLKYNAYGLVKEVRDYNQQLVQTYRYDDRGNPYCRKFNIPAAPLSYTRRT